MKEQDIKKYHILPRNMLSADNYILGSPGRIYQQKGRSNPSEMFSSGCVFIDYSSSYMSINNQVAISANEDVKDKLSFDR